MRLQSVFRIRLIIHRMIRTLRRFAVTFFVLGVLFAALVIGKNVFLGEVRKQIQTTFRYESLRLTALPPALVVDDIQSLSAMPYFKAKRVRIEVPFLSLFRKNKTLVVVIDRPEARLSPEAFRSAKPGRRRSIWPLPFTVERGVIRDGEIFFRNEGGLWRVQGFMALFTQRGEDFSLRAEAEQGSFTSFSESIRVGGRLTLALSGRGEELEISRVTLEGPDVVFKGDGTLRNIRDPELRLETRFDVETSFALPLLDIPFDWKGRATGTATVAREAGELSLQAELGGNRIELNGVPMGEIQGTFNLDRSEGGRLDFRIQKPGRAPEALTLSFKKGRLEGVASQVLIDPVMREIEIPWPVKSPVWGTFSLEKKKLEADAEIRDDSLAPAAGRYGLRGKVKVNVDFVEDDVLVSTDDLESSFARIGSRMRFLVQRDLDAEIRGSIHDVDSTRKFLALVLDKDFDIPEIRGAGFADIRLKGLPSDLTVTSAFTLSPGGFDLFDAEYVKGDFRLAGSGFEGNFHVEDPALNGDIRVTASPGRTEVDVRNGEGDMQAVFPALRVPVSLEGRVSGDFLMVQSGDGQKITGTFTSPAARAFGLPATDVTGDLVWSDGTLSFPRISFSFHEGRIQGRFLLGTATRDFDMDVRADGIDLSSMDPDLKGALSFSLAGRGVFGESAPMGRILIENLTASPLQNAELRGDLSLEYLDDRIEIDIRGGIEPGPAEFTSLFKIPFGAGPLTGEFRGSLENLDLVLPWAGVKGRLDCVAGITGTEGPPRITLDLEMKGPLMPVPGFAHALADYTAAAKYGDGRLAISSFTGKLGGGDVRGSGVFGFGKSGIETIDLIAEGKEMLLTPVERMRGIVDGTMRLVKDDRDFVFEGDLLFKRLSWRRELYERFEFSSAASLDQGRREPSFFDGLSLNVRLHADDSGSMENSLGRVAGRFDLSLTGSLRDPVLLGDIDILNGDIFFQDRAFRVIFGRLSFFNPVSMEPYLDFRGEAYVKDYRVTLNINGPAGRLRPEFSSSPPLSPEEILSLLALGETFRRTFYSYSYDRTNTMSTASLLTFQIADQAKKRTSGLFTLDRLRIDPFVPEQASTEIAARITVGKKISQNLLFIYSTVLASSALLNQIDEVPIFRMEWDIRKDFSLVGGRDDRGKLSLDVKFRKRF